MGFIRSLLFLTLFLTSIDIQAENEITENLIPSKRVDIPMRDGMILPADIYLPSSDSKNLPTILIRSPRGRQTTAVEYSYMSLWGYALVIQDTRNVVDSQGAVVPYESDGWGPLQDGYDTIEWVAKQDFSDGKIGTVGRSALGITQLLLAPTAPSALKCQYISVAAPSLFHYAIFSGGELLKNQVEGWMGFHSTNNKLLPFVAHQNAYNDFWKQFDATPHASQVRVPAIHYGGWYDIFSQGTIDSFLLLNEKGGEGARGTQKLVMGPWHHFSDKDYSLGDFSIPLPGRTVPVDISPKRWLDHYLKGEKNGADKIPPVIYYVMGPFDGTPSGGNVWRTAQTWPIPATDTPFYLSKDKTLTIEKPTYQKNFTFTYDPKNPSPTIGGRNLFLPSGPKDQRPLEKRSDIVVFTSEPLEKDTEVTGRIKGKIFFSTDAEDTDLVVRLCDVYPDGKSILIADGIKRLGSDHKRDPEWTPKNVQEVEVDLWSTSIVFAKDHRIRISISSSNYPRFEKHLNRLDPKISEANSVPAHNTVHVGEKYPSHIILPVVSN